MFVINLIIKRLFDFICSLVIIFFLIPVWIVIPILIKLDSKGPIFFKQERRTNSGKIFHMIKFRSMVVGAENMGTGLFNYENDPRVTKMGRFLRNTSLDELPQLFNILVGSMSFVGPRPCVKYELGDFETLNKKYKKRFNMKAGLTGLAQTKGRNNITWDEKVKFDNEYIDKFKKYGFVFDLKIILNSIFRVFRRQNIYENQVEGASDNVESARLAEEEIIRVAHMLDEE